ncbi:glycosyl hydrolase family 18 protein [Tenacibaculum ovolyticum]|uniref:glycosyl hydrolase family 18 protein n=1 Tax=Tenacibaculum ovolyticum TaxID=104270 RepID=UPI0022F383F9|nr:glycosyl hydrolase family 18 protein [Tenacibaculum ovolyticum]WBX77728.1 glycosyl hydrolase family 18 protein [Tenacibaculum ovolyticum]
MSKLITYYNNGTISLTSATNLPYTDIILAFLYTTPNNPLTLSIAGGIAAATSPPELTQTIIDTIKELKAKGQKVLISFGGAQMNWETYKNIVGHEQELAKSIAKFVKDNNLDGVDIDFEDTASFNGTAGYDGVNFLIQLTQALRSELPSPQYLITHAPQPPYLEAGSGIDGYVKVMQQIGSAIDWLNVQFYNNLPWSSTPNQIVTSYWQFSKLQGLSPEKIMIGLPVTENDAGSGYIPVNDIVTEIIRPIQEQGVLGGMMNWQFSSDKNGVWANTVGQALKLEAPIL